MYAGVIVDITGGKLDKVFTYRIPDALADQITVGMQVIVPFGRGNRQIEAYVIELMDHCPYDLAVVKDIIGISPKGVAVEGQLIRLAGWMKEEYGSSMLQALKTVLPVRQKVEAVVRRRISWKLPEEKRRLFLASLSPKRNAAQLRLLQALTEDGELPYEAVTQKLHISAATIKSLQEKDIITVTEESRYRNPLSLGMIMGQPKAREIEESPTDTDPVGEDPAQFSRGTVVLNREQQSIVDAICAEGRQGHHGTYLIHGITGSGKTEVYMEMIAHTLTQGRQAIVLIPEIALTYQTVMRFYRRFGDRVSILNSRMSAGERYDQFVRAKRGEIQIMVGPRSALFTPFTQLGLIIIDEEHESSYKSEAAPRYHAIGVARQRAAMSGASVVLGSATPSVDSYYKCQTGEYRLFTLKTRAVKAAHLPAVEVVDLRAELEAGNKSILSRRLTELLQDRLQRGEQTILFLNRRGFAGFMSCRSCGAAIKCPHCDVSLTLHRGGRLVCHYCGHEEIVPKVCPSCGSRYIAGFGIGTQKVETMVAQQFPQARILRMDADTTAKKGGHEAILSAFADHQADILIGTQMIVKGHDFPKVTLVGVLAADLSLHSSSYEASERTFQLLTQAAGRAGRGQLPGQVVIQTYDPEHYSVERAAAQDYEGFYEEEIPYRQMLHYPPVYAMMTILFASKDEQAADRAARAAEALVDRYIVRWRQKGMAKKEPEMIGPCDAPVSKISDIYRKMLYIKHVDRQVLLTIKNGLESLAPWQNERVDVLVQYDITGG
ncbi:MAG: primosomal protein N' [Lachnospiraceae bacterium]|nr:primosomal protein N' [Lachnospiraceae bacterium]